MHGKNKHMNKVSEQRKRMQTRMQVRKRMRNENEEEVKKGSGEWQEQGHK